MSIDLFTRKEYSTEIKMKRLSNTISFKSSPGDPDHVNLISSSAVVRGRVKYEEKLQSFGVPEEMGGTVVEEEEDDEEELEDEPQLQSPSSWLGKKKRRLGTEQVKALEKHFEVENKLDPERKVRLAQEVGLQPRQVAVWFQNRRARWKAKQLERDYGALKARHDSLKLDCDALRAGKEALLAEIKELKAKIAASAAAAKRREESKAADQEKQPAATAARKDGACESDSSVVLNDETSPESDRVGIKSHFSVFALQSKGQLGYMDQEGLLSPEELCSSLFSEEAAPTFFSWCCPEGWN